MLDVNIEIAIFLTGGLFQNVLLVGEKYEVKVSIVPVWSETFWSSYMYTLQWEDCRSESVFIY